jgi:hypothetical protein
MNQVDAGHKEEGPWYKEEGPWSMARGYSNEERMKHGVRMVFVAFIEVLAGKAFSAHERSGGEGEREFIEMILQKGERAHDGRSTDRWTGREGERNTETK